MYTMRSLATACDLLSVSGIGYEPHGEIFRDGRSLSPDAAHLVRETLQAAVLCSDATLRQTDSGEAGRGLNEPAAREGRRGW